MPVDHALPEDEGGRSRVAEISPGDRIELGQGDRPLHFLQPGRLPGHVLGSQRLQIRRDLLRARQVGELVLGRVVEGDQVVRLPGLVFECPFGQPRHAVGVMEIDLQDLLGQAQQIVVGVAVQCLGQQEVDVLLGLRHLRLGDVSLGDGHGQGGEIVRR